MMQLSKREIMEIIDQSNYLYEILGNDFNFSILQENNSSWHAIGEKWCHSCAKGDQMRFQKRIEWDVFQGKKEEVYQWISILQKTLRKASFLSWEEIQTSLPFDDDTPIAFQELMVPFVEIAYEELCRKTINLEDFIEKKAILQLKKELLKSLSYIAAPILYKKLCEDHLEILLNAFQLEKKEKITYGKYQQFVTRMLREGYQEFFKEYPVLARLMGEMTIFWRQYSKQVLSHLIADKESLEKNFNDGKALGKIIDIKGRFSDFHHQHQSVVMITFEKGVRLIYKPRNMGMEEGYFTLLDWLNHCGIKLDFKYVKVLNKNSYGWMAYVENLPCNSEEEVREYYYRSGMLLFIAYMLRGTDLHGENVITHGKYPVVIDLEMMMQPKSSMKEIDAWKLEESVLNTGLLPVFIETLKGEWQDCSGFGREDKRKSSFKEVQWQNINSDYMEIHYSHKTLPPHKNLLNLKHKKIFSQDYSHDILKGFDEMYIFFLGNKRKIIEKVQQCFKEQKIRFVVRNTRTYYYLLKGSLEHLHLRRGLDRSIEIDKLARGFLNEETKPLLWPILWHEHEALNRLDIPIFYCHSLSQDLFLSDTAKIDNYFSTRPLDSLLEHMMSLNEKDSEKQQRYIIQSYKDLKNIEKRSEKNLNHKVAKKVPEKISQEKLLKKAKEIGKSIDQGAILSSDDTIRWLQYDTSLTAYQLRPYSIALDLYSGMAGIGIFTAALYKTTEEKENKLLTEKIFQSIFIFLKEGRKHGIIKNLGLGGTLGIPSIVYSLTSVGKLLKDASYLQEAEALVSYITHEMINTDKNHDVMKGRAGMILALMPLYQLTKEKKLLEKMVDCGEKLLCSKEEKKMCGFAHGEGGRALSLLRLYKTTQRRDFLQGAIEAIDFENRYYLSHEKNWSDLRRNSSHQKTSKLMSAWCHGASGILLTRLEALECLNKEEILKDVENALTTTLNTSIEGVDYLCCGNFGRVDILLEASLRLERKALYDEAIEITSKILQREEEKGSFLLSKIPQRNFYNFEFFQGISGIGYSLLRLIAPRELPSVLFFK